ncbi:MAG: hypothetical protein JNM44_14475 [Chitinophagaceae bacterium]|nr:hypothetical protein [Chitinophagaceae bacterium]
MFAKLSFVTLLVFFLSEYLTPLCAQTPLPWHRIPARSIRQEEGLRQGYIPSIMQDADGFMWFATKDGLHRFDGRSMKVYPENTLNHEANGNNPDNDISYVTCDSTGLLWISSVQKGLFIWNPQKARFYPVKGLKNNRGIAFIALRYPYLFIVGSAGWSLYDIRTVWSQLQTQADSVNIVAYSSAQKVNAESGSDKMENLFCTRCLPDKSIWLGGPEGVYRLTDAGTGYRKTFQLEPKQFGMTDQSIYHFFPIGRGDTVVFVGTSRVTWYHHKTNRLLAEYDFSSQAIPKESFYYNYPAQIDQQHILYPTNRGWILLNTSTRRQILVTAPSGDFSGKSRYLSRDGILWVGSGGLGVYQLNLNARHFTIDTTDCFGFLEDDRHQLHVKFRSGTAIFYGQENRKQPAIPDAVLRTGIKEPRLWCSDKKGLLWYGGYSANEYFPGTNTARVLLVCYSAKLNQARLYNRLFRHDTYFNPSGYPSIFFDSSGRCWQIAQSDGRIYFRVRSLDSEHQEQRFQVPDKLRLEKGIYRITCHAETDSNSMWFGTNAGLFKLDIKKKTGAFFEHLNSQPNSLRGNEITSLWPDTHQREILWVGTSGQGISKFNRRTLQCEPFDVTNSLPNQVINAIVQDASHRLWVSTNIGLSCLEPQTNNWIHFTAEDGLSGNEFNTGQFLRLSDGQLIFGGVDGITLFHPDTVLFNLPPSARVLFTALYLGNQKIEFPGDSDILKRPLESTDKLIIPFNKNFLRIEFALLDYHNPTKQKYRYNLKGVTSGWIDNGSNNQLVFSNLPAGNYELEVQGCSANGIWSPHFAKLQIIVLAPWYKRSWFIAFVIAGILFLIYLFYRYRLNQSLKMVMMRNAIASDLHDEIGSTISGISLYIDILQDKLREEEMKGLAQRIGSSSREILTAMSDIVWSINPKNDRFDHVVLRMKSFALEVLELQQIQVVFDVEESTLGLNLPMNQRKNFYLIFKEALNNAVKYAHATEVRISLRWHQSNLLFTLQDNGVGFDTSDYQKGNGIDNMQQRSRELGGHLEIESKPKYGTRIRLSFQVKKTGPKISSGIFRRKK